MKQHLKTALSKRAKKAILAGGAAAVSFFLAALSKGITGPEIVGTVGAGLAAWQTIYWAKNESSRHRR